MKKMIKSVSETAFIILKSGLRVSLGLLFIGIFSYKANKIFWSGSYVNYIWSIKIITSAQSLFVQSFLGTLIYECIRLSKG